MKDQDENAIPTNEYVEGRSVMNVKGDVTDGGRGQGWCVITREILCVISGNQ